MALLFWLFFFSIGTVTTTVKVTDEGLSLGGLMGGRLFNPNKHRCEKTGLRDFRPGPAQTVLYSHRRWLEA